MATVEEQITALSTDISGSSLWGSISTPIDPLGNTGSTDGRAVVTVSPTTWKTTNNTLTITITYDSSVARFDKIALVGSGSSSVSSSVSEVGSSGRATISMSASGGSGFSLYFIPKSNSTSLSVSVSSFVLNGASTSLTLPKISGDFLAPTVASYSPADESAAVSVGSDIVLTFSEAIQRGAGSIVLKTASGTIVESYDVATSSGLSFSGSSMTINPSRDLLSGMEYTLHVAAGTVKDKAGNSYGGAASYNFTTSSADKTNSIDGSIANDSLEGTSGNDVFDGGPGTDTIIFSGDRSEYNLTKLVNGYQVEDNTSGRDGTDAVISAEILQFADMTVDLTMASKAASISAPDLKTLEELYVGFFNRIPEAAGLSGWIDQIKSGVTLKSVADQFYEFGVLFGVYDKNMSDSEFIAEIYANVLGREGANAPTMEEIAGWQNWLHTAGNTKGAMVLEMLEVSHGLFTGHPEVGWVIDLLDNKAEVANYFAVQQGLSYNTPQENINHGTAIAAAITPNSTGAAIALIGVNEFNLSDNLVG